MSDEKIETEIVVPEPTIAEQKKYFCDCCGLSIARILEKLNTCPWTPINEHSETLVRCDGTHFQYNRLNDGCPDFYTKRSVLSFCEYCGVLLQEKDIYGSWEYMGDSGGRPARQYITTGYKCHYCGSEELY